MKKWMSWMLIVCMMVMLPIGAWAQEARDVLQNEQAPELVAQQDGAYAVIYNAEGAAAEKITQRDLIGCVDVSERDTTEDAEVAERLNQAYNQDFNTMMFDVHYGDVECKLHEDKLKDDMNEALKGSDLIAYDLVMYEKFDLKLYGEYADYLKNNEGSTIEMTFQLLDWQGAPIMVVSSADGNKWTIVENVVDNGNGTVTIRFEELGVIAFLLEQEKAAAVENSYQGVIVDPFNGEYPVAPGFTPSASGKPAPEVVPYDGETIAYIESKISDEKTAIKDDGQLIITPLSERDYVVDIQTHEHLEWAYKAIVEAENLGALTAKNTDTTFGEQINAALQAMGTDLTYEDMIVRDLFEITLYGENLEKFYDENNFITLTFAVDVSADEPLLVMVSDDSAAWYTLPAENVQVNNDGTITVHLPDLGAVAFVVESLNDAADMTNAVMSPGAGN